MSGGISTAELKEFVVDHLNIGVFSVDRNMNVLMWNGFMENHTHCHAEQVVGKNLYESFPELPKKWLTRKFNSVFILKNFAFSSWRQRPYLFRFSHNRPITGGIDCMRQDLILMPVKGSSGEVEAVNVALLDMTDVSIFQGMMSETMEQMETLDGIVKTINQETELDSLLNTVIEQGLILFPQADNGICWLVNPQGNFQCAALVHSPLFVADESNLNFIDNLDSFVKTLTISHSSISQLYTANADSPDKGIYHSYQCNDIQDSQLAKLTFQQSTLSIALISEDRVIGYLVFNNYYDDEAFTNVDLPKLKRFREHTVSAITKAKFLQAINEESDKIKNLLDNAGQGFLSFSNNLLIEGEYSAECKALFNTDIEGQSFPSLIKPDDDEQQQFLHEIFKDIFDTDCQQDSQYRLYMSLLPEETQIDDKAISIEYRPIRGKENHELKMLVILTDITEKRALQSKIERERNVLRMIVTSVTKRNDTIKLIREYQQFCDFEGQDILKSEQSLEEIIFELFRRVHTFKGSFSQLDFVHIVDKIHGFESKLASLKQQSKKIDRKTLADICHSTPMWQWLETDLNILNDALGEDILEQEDLINVESNKVSAIEDNMLKTLSPIENQIFLPQIRRLKAKPLKSLIHQYSEYMTRIAESIDKAILPMVITGDEIQVDPTYFNAFTSSLIHVFRNIVDHGIETIEDRIELGKEEYGVVTCHIKQHDNLIVMRISDDGSGIDVDTLRAKIVDNELMSFEEVEQLSDEQIINCIFDQQVSSKQQVSQLSGRGIGLSAVKHAIDELNGQVQVKSSPGEGTTFHFSIPYTQSYELPKVDKYNVLTAVVKQTRHYLERDFHVADFTTKQTKPLLSEQLQLHQLTIFMRVKGLLDGVFLFSFDSNLAKAAAQSMLITTEDDQSDMLIETLNEICNIVLGNSMQYFPGINELVMMDVPLGIETQSSLLSNLSVEVLTTELRSLQGNISISFISS